MRVTLEGATDLGACVALTQDGKAVAYNGPDDDAQVWDATTGKRQLASLRLPRMVTSLAWSPDNAFLAIGCRGGTIRVWVVEKAP